MRGEGVSGDADNQLDADPLAASNVANDVMARTKVSAVRSPTSGGSTHRRAKNRLIAPTLSR
nr:hypothetical protein [Lentzea atacamensis]